MTAMLRLAGSLHEVPHVDKSQADPPAERGRDVAVRDVQLGAGDGRLIGLHGPLVLAHQRDLSVVRLRRNRLGLQQLDDRGSDPAGPASGRPGRGPIALPIGPTAPGTGARSISTRGSSGFDHLAFGEIDLHDLAVDPRADGRRLKGRHRSQETRQIQVDVTARDCRGDDGNRPCDHLGGRVSFCPEEIEMMNQITTRRRRPRGAESATANRGGFSTSLSREARGVGRGGGPFHGGARNRRPTPRYLGGCTVVMLERLGGLQRRLPVAASHPAVRGTSACLLINFARFADFPNRQLPNCIFPAYERTQIFRAVPAVGASWRGPNRTSDCHTGRVAAPPGSRSVPFREIAGRPL